MKAVVSIALVGHPKNGRQNCLVIGKASKNLPVRKSSKQRRRRAFASGQEVFGEARSLARLSSHT